MRTPRRSGVSTNGSQVRHRCHLLRQALSGAESRPGSPSACGRSVRIRHCYPARRHKRGPRQLTASPPFLLYAGASCVCAWAGPGRVSGMSPQRGAEGATGSWAGSSDRDGQNEQAMNRPGESAALRRGPRRPRPACSRPSGRSTRSPTRSAATSRGIHRSPCRSASPPAGGRARVRSIAQTMVARFRSGRWLRAWSS
jgi:hypothetical protein